MTRRFMTSRESSNRASIDVVDMPTRPLKIRVFEKLMANPYLSNKELCKDLNIQYRKQGRTIRQYRYLLKKSIALGLPQRPLIHKRVFRWDCVPRDLMPGVPELSLETWGWRKSKNRNKMVIFNDERGSVHQYKGGLVLLYLRRTLRLADVKALFSKAFQFLSNDDLKRFLDCPLREELRHWVFNVGLPMPRFDIRQFEKSHGIRIFTDGSHPEAVEVEETRPLIMVQFERTLGKFGLEIQAHLNLIQEWQKEAKSRRTGNLRLNDSNKSNSTTYPHTSGFADQDTRFFMGEILANATVRSVLESEGFVSPSIS